MVKSKKEPKI